MREILRANVRFHGRRYLATGLAVSISAAFVMICLALGTSLGVSLKQHVAGQYDGAAAVVTIDPDLLATADIAAPSSDDPRDDPTNLLSAVETIRALPSVVSIAEMGAYSLTATNGTEKAVGQVATVVPEPLRQPEMTEGRLPAAANEIAVNADILGELQLSVGDSVGAYATGGKTAPQTLQIVGTYGVAGDFTSAFDEAFLTEEGMAALELVRFPSELLVATHAVEPSADEQAALVSEIREALSAQPYFAVQSADQAVETVFSRVNVTQGALTAALMIFPLIAIIISMIVISTTFQVIMQQRQRELALLRCLGADSRQIKRLVLGECLTVGALFSAIGVVVGGLLGVGVVVGVGLLDSFGAAMAALGFIWPLLVLVLSVAATLMAGIRPALSVARVSPIQALSPVQASTPRRNRSRRLRGIIGAVIAVGAATCAGLMAGSVGDNIAAFAIVVLLCVVVVAGMIALLSSVLPVLTLACGRLFKGPVAQMAAGNTVRNPSRTAATGVSIFIGVTLIVMMVVGAGSMRSTIATKLDEMIPIDLSVQAQGRPITDSEMAGYAAIEGIEAAEPMRAASATWQVEGQEAINEIQLVDLSTFGVISRQDLTLPQEGEAFLAAGMAADGQVVTVCAEGRCQELVARESDLVQQDKIGVGAATMTALVPDAGTQRVFMRFAEGADYKKTLSQVTLANESFQVEGAISVRAQVEGIVDIVLAAVLGLLAVSVLVALVGVGNTLSLSVAERRRENGLLRALGMTRRQMVRMLGWEAVFISVTAALIGAGAGVFFGIIGIRAVPLGLDAVITIPWLQVVAVLLVAVAAAVLASWVPGWRAAKTSPVEALASE